MKPELSLAVDRQKLIHSGKVLKDDQTVASLGISESDFIVCMISKEVAKVNALLLHFSLKSLLFLLFLFFLGERIVPSLSQSL